MVLVKVTVSLYDPALRLLAAVLMETVTVALPPGAKVPLLDERLSQLWVFAALQLIEIPPEFWRV